MKASKKLITFYKSKVLEPLTEYLKQSDEQCTKERVDRLLKRTAIGKELSCTDMTMEELQCVIVEGFQLGDQVGLFLDYPEEINVIRHIR